MIIETKKNIRRMIIEEAKISSSDSQLEVVGDYILKLKVGEGPLSTLWKASSMVTQEEVALKQVFLSKLNPTLKNCLDCELNFLSSVRHPNIICLLHVIKFQGEGCIFLVMEFCAGGNLSSYMQHNGTVQEKTARRFLQQLGAGLEVLHSHHIIHRDLKPQEIAVSDIYNYVPMNFCMSTREHAV